MLRKVEVEWITWHNTCLLRTDNSACASLWLQWNVATIDYGRFGFFFLGVSQNFITQRPQWVGYNLDHGVGLTRDGAPDRD